MFCSSKPRSSARSGNFLRSPRVPLALARSASSTKIRGSAAMSFSSSAAKMTFISMFSYMLGHLFGNLAEFFQSLLPLLFADRHVVVGCRCRGARRHRPGHAFAFDGVQDDHGGLSG